MKKMYLAALCLTLLTSTLLAQTIPTPKEFFGFNIGDDYQLANFTQTEAYIKKLAASPRAKYFDMGLTEEGRHQFMLIISSPENIKNLERYREISKKMAHAEGLTDDEARKLSLQGKAIVWIDGGLHASETVGIHQLIQTSYELISRNDDETKKILDNDVILMVHCNPDGQELVSDWYMKEKDVKKRNMSVPRLWEKYVGHDNNRDSYMMNLKESQNITHQQFIDWIPQIVYNHHQAGPAGSVVAGPPFRDPFNYLYDPLLMTSIDEVGSAMNSRLNAEGKPGYTQRSGTQFSTWFNGGVRTATYFHNTVGLLTEIIGSPTPSNIPVVPERLIPNSATPFPVLPQEWHFKQSIDYSLSLNYAVLNYAARHYDELLFNAYRMGKNSIERGSQDYWTLSPMRADAIVDASKAVPDTSARGRRGGRANGAVTVGGQRNGNIDIKYYNAVLKNPELRDPRGYIISVDQPDFATAVKFVNICIRSGLIVQKATAAFTVKGKNYPAGSYILKTDQAFRPEVLDRFEPQNHPNDFLYPGGPPIKPYDMTGWTVAYQMGIKFDRILDDFTGPFQRIPYGELQPMPVAPAPAVAKNGYFLSPYANNSFIAVNDLLQAGATVYRLTAAAGTEPAGTFYVAYSDKAKKSLEKSAKELDVKASTATKKPKGMTPIAPARIALWNEYGGSIPSGWIRWMMEQYHFPFKVVYPQEFDAGDLKSKFDVIVFVAGAVPPPQREAGGAGAGGGARGGRNNNDVPDEFKTWTGRVTVEKTVPQLKAFMEAGGTIVTIGSSANLAYDLNLPVHDALVDKVDGKDVPFSGDKFFIPGTVLRASIDNKQPATYGMFDEADVMFDSSPAFKLDADAATKGVKPLMWFATDKPLRSGWAWGQQYLKDDVAAFSAQIGAGMLYSFGPEITFRAQPHGTFKLLFNELYKK